MANQVHSDVTQLPRAIEVALHALGYRRKSIAIEAHETVSIACMGGSGLQGFAAIVNLSTGRYEVRRGSWGGSNMFNPENPVDNCTKEFEIPNNIAVIRGHRGGSRPVYATIAVRPDCIANYLTSNETVTDLEARILYCYKAIKGGQYRREALEDLSRPGFFNPDPNPPSRETVDYAIERLIERKLLKRNKAGATQITTAGRNAWETNPKQTR